MALAGIRERYSRSIFGQWWIVLQGLLLNVSIGLLWSKLWGQDVSTFLPYLALGFFLYSWFSTIVSESTGCLQEFSRYLLSTKLSIYTILLSVIYRNFIIFLHNFLGLVLIFMYFETDLTFSFNLAINILGILIVLFFMSYPISFVCARYRDLRQVILAIMSVLYLLTPVMWNIDQVGSYREIILLNPFASFLNVTRDLVLGNTVYIESYYAIAIFFVLGLFFSIIVNKIYNRKILYWI